MKKITLLLLMFSVFSYAQDKPFGTTLDEYNYMTKGYKIQVSSGLDVKKGYRVDDVTSYATPLYDFNFKSLVREKDGVSAGLILVATSKMWSNVYYLGIPVDNAQLFGVFNADVNLWDESMTTAYSEASSYLMAHLYRIYSLPKSVK
ncbi:hypothetical protein [Flavobacterium gawalongense]|uniref:Uncharacterized protein n=1 Tax=Flavobacterium gawalongense TaxID=2594432 RepID=A0ABY3CG65_9FLAO|nr:hypothetical protein [Flavobacterium gawalongense]TRW98504.1 hypothetical protein FNW33_15960 [Flavobacterium gawalongense]TRX02881.1 hypothetical protein FNW12_15865 [Flavobacterium gawalongense]